VSAARIMNAEFVCAKGTCSTCTIRRFVRETALIAFVLVEHQLNVETWAAVVPSDPCHRMRFRLLVLRNERPTCSMSFGTRCWVASGEGPERARRRISRKWCFGSQRMFTRSEKLVL